MAYATILTETRDRVRYVTLNRPERRNALSLELQNELLDALTATEQDEEAGCIVIRGAGPAFCSGFDITPPANRYATYESQTDREIPVVALRETSA